MPAVLRWLKVRCAVIVAGRDSGAAAVEYGLLVALIAVAIIAAVVLLGGRLSSTFTCSANSLPTGSTAAATPAC